MGIIRNEQVFTLKEHQAICETVDHLDNRFTDEIIEQAEFFDVEEDPITLQTTITLYNEVGTPIFSTIVEDYEYAMAYMEEVFDIEDFEEFDEYEEVVV